MESRKRRLPNVYRAFQEQRARGVCGTFIFGYDYDDQEMVARSVAFARQELAFSWRPLIT